MAEDDRSPEGTPSVIATVRTRILTAPLVRVELVREPGPLEDVKIPVRSAADAYALLKDESMVWDRERFFTLLLDNKHFLIAIEEVSVGSLTSTVVHPREVFKSVILANAAAFLIAHHHPSGDPTPSREDIEITRRLREGAEIFGIRCLDHIVIGDRRYVSFVNDGYW